jgi:uncharacterized membrane protein
MKLQMSKRSLKIGGVVFLIGLVIAVIFAVVGDFTSAIACLFSGGLLAFAFGYVF